MFKISPADFSDSAD